MGFFGRDTEVAWLRGSLQDKEPVILITGEAGIGKTRLLEETLPTNRAWVAFPGARFAAPGFGLWGLAVIAGPDNDSLARELGGPERPGKLGALMTATDAIVCSLDVPVLVFDDLQWADGLTLSWLAQVAPVLEECKTKIVLAVRAHDRLPSQISGALANLYRRRLVRSLKLEPLSVTAVAVIARSFGRHSWSSNASELHRLTDGVPLAVEEVLRATETPSSLMDEVRYPLLAAVLREQLSDLQDHERDVLLAAALAPQPPDEEILRTVSGLPPERFEDAVARIVASGLLVRDQNGIKFRHDLHREALSDELTFEERRPIHRRIARVLISRPTAHAGDIASQLAEARLNEEATRWFIRAADEAVASHDHGTAISHLTAALGICPHHEEALRAEICELLPRSARVLGDDTDLVGMVQQSLTKMRSAEARGKTLRALAKLCSIRGDFPLRAKALVAAADEFRTAGDDLGLVRALGDLALPMDEALPLIDRVGMGREALAIAEERGSVSDIALCAGNLAAAELALGHESAFSLWSRAVDALRPSAGEVLQDRITDLYNWAFGALAFGRYDSARAVLAEASALADEPQHTHQLDRIRTVLLWRTGEWDQALTAAANARRAADPDVVIVDAVETMIRFEREPRTSILPLVEATAKLIDYRDYYWGCLAMALLIRARAARREPTPERGVLDLIQRIVQSGLLVGWDDLLPATAALPGDAYVRVRSMLGGILPSGPRGEAAAALAEGVHASRYPTLMGAADGYEDLGEPYMQARSLEAAARFAPTSAEEGRLALLAAEIYEALGADRSLAQLLRHARRTRPLQRFVIPSSQRGGAATGLTPREREVAELARIGYTAAEIANSLIITESTARNHLEKIKRKLGVDRKSELVRLLGGGA